MGAAGGRTKTMVLYNNCRGEGERWLVVPLAAACASSLLRLAAVLGPNQGCVLQCLLDVSPLQIGKATEHFLRVRAVGYLAHDCRHRNPHGRGWPTDCRECSRPK
jgi:hypothetical protein